MLTQPISTIINEDLGQAAEKEVAQALSYLQERGEIREYYLCTRYSREDESGIDFIAYVSKHWHPVPLQVKHSKWGCRQHRRKHPHIPLIVVLQGDILKQIRKVLHLKQTQREQLLRAYKIELFMHLAMLFALETSPHLEIDIVNEQSSLQAKRTQPKRLTGYIDPFLKNKAQSA